MAAMMSHNTDKCLYMCMPLFSGIPVVHLYLFYDNTVYYDNAQ